LEAQIRGDVLSDVQLAVTEAATNAVRHSGCVEFVVQGRVSDATLIVAVWDQGPGRADPDPGGGAGQEISALAESVDFERTEPSTRVTMRFARHTYI
jgi:anti-sigma regulatory factor (Ser/Thr protein kinase)